MAGLDRFRAGLLEREKAALQEAGFIVTAVDVRPTGWVLSVMAPDSHTGRGELPLTIECPLSYPLTAPTVKADQLGLMHHQNPFTGELCLLDRPLKSWRSEWTLADYLVSQLATALAAGAATPDEAALAAEADQGEPFSIYYDYAQSVGILIDAPEVALTHANGVFDFTLALRESLLHEREDADFPGRLLGSIDTLHDGSTALHRQRELDRVMRVGRIGHGVGYWVAVDEAPRHNDPSVVWRQTVNPANKSLRTAVVGDEEHQLLALNFEEERTRSLTGRGWLFVLKTTRRVPKKTAAARRTAVSGETFRFVRAYPAGQADLTYRAPATHGVESKSVMLMGCGAVGSVIVEHLARAGVGHFTLIDFDHLEPGNLSRHAGGFDTVAMPKIEAMAHKIWQVNPYANLTLAPGAVGVGVGDAEAGGDEVTALGILMAKSDLVVDATAEVSLQQYTSVLARDNGVAWVSADATIGLAGGSVVQSPSQLGGCYWCFLFHQQEGTIPSPNVFDSEDVQPAGCGQRTFTGSGFDLAVVSAQAARVIIAALLVDVPQGYPSDGYDAHILAMRADDGSPCPPFWSGYSYGVHELCALHA